MSLSKQQIAECEDALLAINEIICCEILNLNGEQEIHIGMTIAAHAALAQGDAGLAIFDRYAEAYRQSVIIIQQEKDGPQS